MKPAEQRAFTHFFVSGLPAYELKVFARLIHLVKSTLETFLFDEFYLFVYPPRQRRAAFYELFFKRIKIS